MDYAQRPSMEELTMKTPLGGVALAAIVALALPAWSQSNTTSGQSTHTQQSVPGADGGSKPGIPGLPGGKSGPTVTPSGTTVPESKGHPNGDQSGVKGLPGNKSGPTVTLPSGVGR
jgi:hypothetical protein